jgi:acetoin utilization deacetylase AcuC-like enzyme
VPIVYSERYQHSVLGVPLDPLRGERILAALAEAGLLPRNACSDPRPASFDSLLRVHTPAYLQSLHGGEALERILGVDLDPAEAEATLDLHRLLVGGTIQATRLALRSGRAVVHLGGGFHHALPGAGMGFCVFNDVAVAVTRLRARGFRGRVLVVDLDLHDGNGTRAIFAADPTVHTLSVHHEHWGDVDAVESTSIALGPDVEDARYLECLRETLPGVFARFRPELVYYLAGTDVAVDDVLGNWRLTADGIRARDRLVTELARPPQAPLPLVALLAGGYGTAAWRYSARYLLWLASGRELEPAPEEELALRRFRRLRAALPIAEAQGGDLAFSFSEEDLVGLQPQAPSRFLEHLSRNGAELLLERLGILPQIRARGFRSLDVALKADPGGAGHTLRVTSGRGELLMELRAGRSRAAVPGMEVLAIEWLLLQNPRAAFSRRRPRLPGQQHPGLGLLRDVVGSLVLVCEEHGLDGLHFVAAHYHVAMQSRRLVRLLHPEDEARVRACSAALLGLSLAEAAAALAEGRVVAPDGQPFLWTPAPCVLPVSGRLGDLVAGAAYEEAVTEASGRLAFRLLDPVPARIDPGRRAGEASPGGGRKTGPGRRSATAARRGQGRRPSRRRRA